MSLKDYLWHVGPLIQGFNWRQTSFDQLFQMKQRMFHISDCSTYELLYYIVHWPQAVYVHRDSRMSDDEGATLCTACGIWKGFALPGGEILGQPTFKCMTFMRLILLCHHILNISVFTSELVIILLCHTFLHGNAIST